MRLSMAIADVDFGSADRDGGIEFRQSLIQPAGQQRRGVLDHAVQIFMGGDVLYLVALGQDDDVLVAAVALVKFRRRLRESDRYFSKSRSEARR